MGLVLKQNEDQIAHLIVIMCRFVMEMYILFALENNFIGTTNFKRTLLRDDQQQFSKRSLNPLTDVVHTYCGSKVG